jgi:hypothetical protein
MRYFLILHSIQLFHIQYLILLCYFYLKASFKSETYYETKMLTLHPIANLFSYKTNLKLNRLIKNGHKADNAG